LFFDHRGGHLFKASLHQTNIHPLKEKRNGIITMSNNAIQKKYI